MSELEEKTERLTRLARELDLGGILILSQPGFAWLTCGGSNRVDGSRENGSGALLVRADGRRFVIANGIEMPRLRDEELAGQGWEPIEYPWTEDHARPDTLARRAAADGGVRGAIGADWRIAGTQAIEGRLLESRGLLTEAELTRYRALGRDAGAALGDVARTLQPGLAETEIARRISDAAASIGGRAVVTLVAADDRIARYRHPLPTTRAWVRTVMLVSCIQRQGLVVALTRIVSSSAPAPDLLRRTEASARVFGALLDATRSGTTGRDLFEAARRAYAEVGFAGEELRHHQGGAIGYRSRDWVAHPASADVVRARQAFAWNPSITGTKVEDTALLTDGGLEIISASPEWPMLDARASAILQI